MTDFGANIVMQGIRNNQIDQQAMFDRLMDMSRLGETRRQFDDTMAFNRTKPKDLTMDEADLLAVQAYQSGDRSPQVMQRLKARAAMEGMKTQYSKDELGNLVPSTAPNPFDIMLRGGGAGDKLFGAAGMDEMPEQPSPMRNPSGAGDMLFETSSALPQIDPRMAPDRPLNPAEFESMSLTGELPEPEEALPSTNPGDALIEESNAATSPIGRKATLESGLKNNETANKRRQDRIAVLEEAAKKMPEALIQLKRAQELNDEAYGGAAAIAGPAINKWVNGTLERESDDKADNTTELDNLLKGAGMASIKEFVGSQAISDGDRKSVLELQGAVEMNPDSRKRIIDKNYQAAQRASRINELERQTLASGRDWTAADSRRIYREEFGIDFDTGEKISGTGKGTGYAPVRVNSVAEAQALPAGTVFVTPDGRRKVKP